MHGLQFTGDHGGISVSFPSLTQPGGDRSSYSSTFADVQADGYTTGLSQVTFHQPGATIYHRENNRQFQASNLLVESDNPTWSTSDDRTLTLRITPKHPGEFPVRIRGWLCRTDYTDCERNPQYGGEIDQQGWVAVRLTIVVTAPQTSQATSTPQPQQAPTTAQAPKPTPALLTGPFNLNWQLSTTTVQTGEPFTLTIRMHDLQLNGEHGGISVSFPSLTQPGGNQSRHSSPAADVQAVNYSTGLSQVTFHQPGATIYHREGNRQFPAENLLVESDDPSWSRSDDRTLTLLITPKQAGSFPLRIRGWLCRNDYTDCERNPSSGGDKDQQGWDTIPLTINVTGPSAAQTSSPPAASAYHRFAQTYAPVLRMHRLETVFPSGAETMIRNAILRDTDGNYVDDQPSPLSAEYLGSISQSHHRDFYLDLYTAAPYWFDEAKSYYPDDTNNRAHAEYDDAAANLGYDDFRQPTVYVRWVIDQDFLGETLGGNALILQYWLFYPLDRNHEGDWEMIQLEFNAETLTGSDHAAVENHMQDLLDAQTVPTRAFYSSHGLLSNAVCWAGAFNLPSNEDPIIQHEGLNPHVFVARGSHANYFAAGDYSLGTPWNRDVTQNGGTALVPPAYNGGLSDIRTYDIVFLDPSSNNPPWINFRGKWGEKTGRSLFEISSLDTKIQILGDGPSGPQFSDIWQTPRNALASLLLINYHAEFCHHDAGD